jgi:hypothetical protein
MWPTLPPFSYIAGCFRLVTQSAATSSRWFLARGFICPEDGGDTFPRNIGSHDIGYTQRHIQEDGIIHGIGIALFSGTQHYVDRWKRTDVSEDHVASIFEGRGISHDCLLPPCVGFLLRLIFGPENGGDVIGTSVEFNRTTWLIVAVKVPHNHLCENHSSDKFKINSVLNSFPAIVTYVENCISKTYLSNIISTDNVKTIVESTPKSLVYKLHVT